MKYIPPFLLLNEEIIKLPGVVMNRKKAMIDLSFDTEYFEKKTQHRARDCIHKIINKMCFVFYCLIFVCQDLPIHFVSYKAEEKICCPREIKCA